MDDRWAPWIAAPTEHFGPLDDYDGPQGRSITMEPLFGGWYVQVTPAK